VAARFYNRVFAALRFEMIFRFVECDPSALLDVIQRFFGKIDVAIKTSTDCGSAKRNLAPAPDAAAIEAVIDAAFWASLRREEGYLLPR